MDLIIHNWAYFATALWAISEILTSVSTIKSNSIFEVIYNALQRFKK